ncbi:MAG: SpoIIE family protein phosphatase [Gemmataceae bacterium]|nr:SpoIIE family protein phosphatase [Gemmataceae bacterium]
MRVLIADDDPVSRHLLLRTLEGWKYDVVAAKDGSEAWRLLQEGDFPLVVLDWSMPGLDGPELVRRLRALPRPGYVYTVLLAASSEKEEFVLGLEAGADDFLVKPLDREVLRVRLRSGERVLRLEQTLVEQNHALAERNRQMEADLRMACEVQQALLPQGYPSFPAGVPMEKSRLRFIDRYRPDGAVGGDFFIVLPLSDTRACVFVADVMGHGVRAALGTAMVRALVEGLRHVAHAPETLLTDMNRELVAILGQASAPMFLSAFCGVMDTVAGELRYANAGHPDPILVRRGDGSCAPLPPPGGHHGPPLGVRPGAAYSVATIDARPGDLFVFYTDGLIEATDAGQAPFGEPRLCEAFRKRLGVAGGRLFDEVLGEVLAYTQGRGFADDVCLVGMEVRGES